MPGFGPFEFEMIPIPIFESWFAWGTRGIKGVLSQDGISSLQRFRIALRVDGLDSKEILVHAFQTFNMT
jgi:hypothetical protein